MVRLCKSILAVLLVTSSVCYACKTKAMFGSKPLNQASTPEAFGIETNKDLLNMHKKLFDLKRFKLETIRKNLRIDPKAFSNIINKKINELGLSNAAFDSLRKSVKSNKERIKINELENKFLEIQVMIEHIVQGFPQTK